MDLIWIPNVTSSMYSQEGLSLTISLQNVCKDCSHVYVQVKTVYVQNKYTNHIGKGQKDPSIIAKYEVPLENKHLARTDLHTCTYICTNDFLKDSKGINGFQHLINIMCNIVFHHQKNNNTRCKVTPNTSNQSLFHITVYSPHIDHPCISRSRPKRLILL